MKIERRYMAHYLNAAFGSGEASYTRLGRIWRNTPLS